MIKNMASASLPIQMEASTGETGNMANSMEMEKSSPKMEMNGKDVGKKESSLALIILFLLILNL